MQVAGIRTIESNDVAAEASVVDRSYRLADNLTAEAGRVYLSGTQAIVRMLLAQRRSDRERGLKTAGFVSGYRGSPLAALDTELWRSSQQLVDHDITFLPAVNEDLAATAVQGTQQVGLDPKRRRDGVFAMWYGKGPGVDRAGDALRHGNAAGSSRHGGVLMVVGDDHAATSSSLPNASDLSLMGWGIPTIHPASVAEYEEFGLWGWAASRYSSTWIAFKAISETVESGRSVTLQPPATRQTPLHAQVDSSALEYRTDDFLTARVEQRLAAKLDALRVFAKANPLDRIVVDAPEATIGIVVVGKVYQDLMEVLQRSEIDHDELARLGVRVIKVGLTYPLESTRIGEFCRGLRHVLVIEEKASVVEQQLKDLVFNWPERPSVCGKTDLRGAPLVTWLAQISAADLSALLHRWLVDVSSAMASRIEPSSFARPALAVSEADGMRRLPYFCSGCPHNTSTRVPEGSQALGGVGCHYMASWMDRSTGGLTQMGGEGADWLGRASFTDVPHVFQNMGEGTYFHSGYLAIRQAIAAKANITYKILYNDAVAMTGGQPVDGSISVAQICTQVASEGARRVVVVTDTPDLYADGSLPPNVPVHHRRDLDAVQRQLRKIEGVTVLVYEQTCAAEKRRRRKRNAFPDPAKRLFINAAVCEGCGDCGVQSNCLSIAPLETELGRKRRIEQSTCNKDYSCVEGFCPSFVTVLGGTLRGGTVAAAPTETVEASSARLPRPTLPTLAQPYDLLIAGVGGTGVITVGALVAMAAHLEGKGTSVLDFTALAQKGGSVVSHVRIAAVPEALHAVRVQWRQARALLVADMVVGALADVLATVRRGTTQVLVNPYLQPLAEFTRAPDIDDRATALLDKFKDAAGEANVEMFDAHKAATTQFGDAVSANAMLLGYAWQKGLIPVSLEALLRAIELNGVAIEANRKAFSSGRIAAHGALAGQAALTVATIIPLVVPEGLEKTIATRHAFLCGYQNQAYADRYVKFVRKAEAAERAVTGSPRRPRLALAVARSLFRLMAYKDEYEVARLYSRPEFKAQLDAQFEGAYSLRVNLAPPVLAKRNAKGELVKREFGAWIFPIFKGLAALRVLRGTPFDVFGYTAERRQERRLIDDYRQLVDSLLADLTVERLDAAVEAAALAEKIRGFGHVKKRSVRDYRQRLAELQDQGSQLSSPSARAKSA
jgi:indolepyruvate ferredoxin oxidoreductase